MYRILVITFVSGLLAITAEIAAHADEADVDFTDLLQESNTDLDAVGSVEAAPAPPSLQYPLDSPTVWGNEHDDGVDAQLTMFLPSASEPNPTIEAEERSTTQQSDEATPPSTTTLPGEEEEQEELPWQQLRTKEISIPVRIPVVELVVLNRTLSLPTVPGQHLSSDTALTPRPRYRRRARNVYSEFVHRAEVIPRPRIVESKPTQRPKPETVTTMAPVDLRKAVAPVADFIAAFRSVRTQTGSTASTGLNNGTQRSPATDQVVASQKTSTASGDTVKGGPQKPPTDNASKRPQQTSPATNDIATSQTTRPSGTNDDSQAGAHQMSTAEAAAQLDQMASLFTSKIKSVLDAQPSNDTPVADTISATGQPDVTVPPKTDESDLASDSPAVDTLATDDTDTNTDTVANTDTESNADIKSVAGTQSVADTELVDTDSVTDTDAVADADKVADSESELAATSTVPAKSAEGESMRSSTLMLLYLPTFALVILTLWLRRRRAKEEGRPRWQLRRSLQSVERARNGRRSKDPEPAEQTTENSAPRRTKSAEEITAEFTKSMEEEIDRMAAKMANSANDGDFNPEWLSLGKSLVQDELNAAKADPASTTGTSAEVVRQPPAKVAATNPSDDFSLDNKPAPAKLNTSSLNASGDPAATNDDFSIDRNKAAASPKEQTSLPAAKSTDGAVTGQLPDYSFDGKFTYDESVTGTSFADSAKKAPTTSGGRSSAKRDDLKRIHGIGPAIEKLLHQALIFRYSELADADVDVILQILQTAGAPFNQVDPSTWPVQAALAMNSEWDRVDLYKTQATEWDVPGSKLGKAAASS